MDRHKKEHPYRNYERDEILNKDVKALDDREEEFNESMKLFL